MSKQQPIKGNEVKNYFVRPRKKKKNDRSIPLFLGQDLTKKLSRYNSTNDSDKSYYKNCKAYGLLQ